MYVAIAVEHNNVPCNHISLPFSRTAQHTDENRLNLQFLQPKSLFGDFMAVEFCASQVERKII